MTEVRLFTSRLWSAVVPSITLLMVLIFARPHGSGLHTPFFIMLIGLLAMIGLNGWVLYVRYQTSKRKAGEANLQLDVTAADKSALQQKFDRLHQCVLQLQKSLDLGEADNSMGDAITKDLDGSMQSIQSIFDATCENMNQVSNESHRMSGKLNNISTVAEYFSDSIRNLTKYTKETEESTDSAVLSSETLEKAMVELGATIKSIEEMTGVIKRIAGQTNLLALNATIEAATTGDAGKGFSVIANEIKALAARSENEGKRIEAIIEEVQKRVNLTMKDAQQITSKIQFVQSSFDQVNKEIKEQNTVSQNISVFIKNSSTTAKRISASLQKVEANSSQMRMAIENITTVIGALPDYLDEINSSGGGIDRQKTLDCLGNLEHAVGQAFDDPFHSET